MNIFIIVIVALLMIEIPSIILVIRYMKIQQDTKIKVANINSSVERIRLYSTFDFDKINNIIDRYIDDAGKLYKINNFEYKNPEEVYLSEEIMNDMIKSMVTEVMKKITPAVFSLLQLSYNITTRDDLISFLYEKIKMYVLTYSLEVNDEIQ